MSSGGSRRTPAVSPTTIGGIAMSICRAPVDFRLGIDSLSRLIEATLESDPFGRNLFCFVDKRRNRNKVRYWRRSGFCLGLQCLEEEMFKWPAHLAPLASGINSGCASGTPRPEAPARPRSLRRPE